MLTYQLIPGGFEVLMDGQVVYTQPFNPELPGFQPFTEEEARTRAQAFIAANEAVSSAPDAVDAPAEA